MSGAKTHIALQIFGLQSPPVSQHVCVAPSKSLFDDIEHRKIEINGLNDQLRRLNQELDAEKLAIEADRISAHGDQQKIHNLNVKISARNEKSGWYNRVLVDAKAKSVILKSMIREYNNILEAYNNCRASN